jgi:hypothetical protein
MAAITYVSRKVRLANTHNVLTRTRPLAGTANVGEVAKLDANGNWVKSDGTGPGLGVIIGISDGRVEGLVGDDAEVLMWGIVAGYEVDPGEIVYDGEDGSVADSGTVVLGVGLNDNLLYIRPSLA